jgi:hypothetical protein
MPQYTFSQPVLQWLEQHRSFLQGAPPVCDPLGGRSLGPASGTLGDCFPFLTPSSYHGLLAGLSISGLDEKDTCGLRLVAYESRTGFHPIDEGPFERTQWQTMTSDDWLQINPAVYTPCNFQIAYHEVDLAFTSDNGTRFSTTTWKYFGTTLSEKYRQHCWISPETGVAVTAVTFTAVAEHQAPFLRPCFVSDGGVFIDPYCFFSAVPKIKLYSGLTILTAGEGVQLSVADEKEDGKTVITVSKTLLTSEEEDRVKTISNIPPNKEGHFMLNSSGCYKFLPVYDLLNPGEGLATLTEGTLSVQNQCTACCQCEEYVEQYETLRELFVQQTDSINLYNEDFNKTQENLTKLKEYVQQASQLVQVHYAAAPEEAFPVTVEDGEIAAENTGGDPSVITVGYGDYFERAARYTFSITYANISGESKTFGETIVRLVSEKGVIKIIDAQLAYIPDNSGLSIEGMTENEIHLSSATIRSRTAKAVDLIVYLALTGSDSPAEALGKVTVELTRSELTDSGSTDSGSTPAQPTVEQEEEGEGT